MAPGHRAIAVGALLLTTIALYATRLNVAPIYLMHDEVNFALQAQSVAATGRDTNGRLLPLYFSETGFEAGRDPIVIYATAAMLAMRPLSESAVRMPTALVGVLSVLLMFLLARRLFGSDAIGLAAAVTLALTPAHFINSRLVLSIVYPVPFILGWLLCLSSFAEREDRRQLQVAAFVLGVGVYSYLASALMMPLYLLLTLWFIRERALRLERPRLRRTLPRSGQAGGRWMWHAVAAFALALLPLVLWQIAHPNRYADLVSAYRLYDAPDGSASLFSASGLSQRISVLWRSFSPDYLFISGDSRMTNSTRQAGLFPIAFAVLVPLGIWEIARGRGGPLGKVILAGFITAPLASVVSGRLEINRVLFIIPFGVLTAGYGLQCLFRGSSARTRWLATALIAAVPLQFAFFHADYLGSYRESSGIWFGGDVRGAVEQALARAEAQPAAVYLNARTPVERYWRFYALAHRRADLVDAPIYYDAEQLDITAPPAGAVIVCESGLRVCNLLGASPAWRRLRAFAEADGTPTFEVFERP